MTKQEHTPGTDLARLLDQAAAHDHHETADQLEALRVRLGRDGLSVDEWNALVGAASHLRIEGWRRERRALAKATQETDHG